MKSLITAFTFITQLSFLLRRGFFKGLPLILLVMYSLTASAQSIEERRISISFDNVSIKEALRKVEIAGSLVISYMDDDLIPVARISGKYDQKTIAFILTAFLDKYNLTYRYSGSNVFILKKNKPKEQKKGILTGQVKDLKSGDPLIGVTIKIAGTGTQTEPDGSFRLELPAGIYPLEITYMGYLPVRQDKVQIAEGKETKVAISLNEDANALSEVIITDWKVTGTNVALVQEIRSANAVTSGISREQISRSQDRDGAEVVRRIPGVSVMQNRFIVVRGLPQRYNTVMLNNAIAPSFEADSRAFSFDIIPSSMIDRVMIYKTAVPELPADFAGGMVKVYTTGMPVKNSLNVSYQASYRAGTTGSGFFEEPQGKHAWLGYDDGTYMMPKGVPYPINRGARREVTPLFNNNWNAVQHTAPLDSRFSLDFARKINLTPKVKLGIVGGVNYSNTYQYRVESRSTGLNTSGQHYELAYNFSDQVYTHMARVNGLLNVSADIAGKHRIDFKNLYTHTGEYEYTNRNGVSGELAGDGTGLAQDQYIHQMIMTNSFRAIQSSQLNGSHELFRNTHLNWLLGYTKSRYDDPDQRRRTQKAPIVADDSGHIAWEEPYSPNSVSDIYWGRFYYRLPETTRTFGLDIVQPLALGAFTPTVKAGVYIEKKDRSYEMRRLGLLLHTYDDNGDGKDDNDILVGETYYAWDTYEATNDLTAGYAAVEVPFLQRFKLYGGVRMEDNRQQMHTFTYQGTQGKIDIDNHKVSLLPSANLSFDLTGKSLIRLAYSQTLNRPEFREIEPFFYLDLRTFSTAFGNPDLKPQTDIYNYDLRYEWYPAAGEMFNLGFFYKKFLNPIEYFYYNATSGRNSYMWGNGNKATNYGAEVDMILSLGRLTKGTSRFGRNLERTTFLFNAAYIYSEVDLGDKAQVYQDKKRPLFGQSPYTINGTLSYTIDSIGLKLNIAYNIIGKRIIMVGNDQNPNVYELPRHALDLTFSKRIGRIFEIKGGVQNILNSRNLQMQDSDRSGLFDVGGADYTKWKDNRYLSWYNGTYYTLGLGLRL